MYLEILVGFVISLMILYLFYLYLGWCNGYSGKMALYRTDPMMVMKADKEYLDKYQKYMLPVYLSDTYKPIRFAILYRIEKLTI